MKATEAKFLEFLKKSPQFIIPIYQRTYSWTLAECRQLWPPPTRSHDHQATPPASGVRAAGTPARTDGAWLILPKEAEPNPG